MPAATGVAASPGDTQMSRETAGPRPDGGPTAGPGGGGKSGGAEELGTAGADGAESAPRVSFRLPEATGAAASPGKTQRSRETAGSRPNGGPAGGPEGGAEGGGAEALGAARIGREPTPHGSSRLPAATGAAASPGDAQRSREMAGPRPDCGSSEIFAVPSPVPPSPTFPSSGDAPREVCRGGGHGPSAKAPGGVRRRLR